MRTKSTLLSSLALSLIGLFASAAVWSSMPDPMPVHWDAAGLPNGFASKAVGLLLFPILGFCISALIELITRRSMKEPAHHRALTGVVLGTQLFMLAIHGLVIHSALHPTGAMAIGAIMLLLGVFWVGLGACMPHLPQNKWAGVRTPWSLRDETNWKLTHRFAAKSMAAGGVLAALSGFVSSGQVGFWLGFTALIVSALLPLVFSYALHKARA